MRTVAWGMAPPKNPLEITKPALAICILASIPALFDLAREVAATCLGIMVVGPILLLWLRSRRLMINDPIIVIGIMWGLAASLPVLLPIVYPGVYRDPLWTRLTPWSLDAATLWMYRAWAGCAVAYWVVRMMVGSRRFPVSPGNLVVEDRLRLLVGVLGLAASVAYIVMTGGQSYSHIEGFAQTSTADQIVHEVRQLAKLYIFLHFHARGRGRLTPRERYLLWATFAVLALIFAASSSKTVALEVAAMWALGSATGGARGKLLREFALGSGVLAVTYFTFYFVTAYRVELLAAHQKPDASFSEVVSIQFDAMQLAAKAVIEGKRIGSDENEYNLGSMFDRLAYVSGLAMVFEYTNGYSPYEHATASIFAPLLAIVPRDLVGEKIQFLDSGKFAKLIGWTYGGFSISVPGSLFWSWGYEGIVPGMMVLGLLLGVSAQRGEADGSAGLIWRTLMIRLVMSMLDPGNEYQSIMIGVTRTMLFLLAMLFVARNLMGRSGTPPAYSLRQWKPK